jgi:hypothetical protein
MHECIFDLMGSGFGGFSQTKKSPLVGGLRLTEEG